MSTTKTAKPETKQKRSGGRFSTLSAEMVQADPAWIHSRLAAKRISVSLPLLYDVIRSGQVRSFLFKRTPEAQTGRRLIYWPDLERYMERRCEEANRAGQKVWVPVKRKGSGRSIKQEVPAAIGLRPKATGKMRFRQEVPAP